MYCLLVLCCYVVVLVYVLVLFGVWFFFFVGDVYVLLWMWVNVLCSVVFMKLIYVCVFVLRCWCDVYIRNMLIFFVW